MEQRQKTAIIAISLLFVLTSASFASVFGGTGGTDGTFDNYTVGNDTTGQIPISSGDDLKLVGTDHEDDEGRIWSLDAAYHLADHIVLTGKNNHVPIGSYEDPFTGTFNGNSMSIVGIDIDVIVEDRVLIGLFGYTDGALIYDLNVGGSFTVSSGDNTFCEDIYAGGIVGHAVSTTISNCQNDVTIGMTLEDEPPVMAAAYAGGIVGHAVSSVIENCRNTGTVHAEGYYEINAGGIAGRITANEFVRTVTGCSNSGDITARSVSAQTGGIAGAIVAEEARFLMTDCSNSGDIAAMSSSAAAYAGGMIGYASYYEGMLILTDCINSGDIAAGSQHESAFAGGAIGLASGTLSTVTDCSNSGNIATSSQAPYGIAYTGGLIGNTSAVMMDRCVNTGAVTTETEYGVCIGGIIGYASGKVTNSHNAGPITAVSVIYAYTGGITGKTSSMDFVNCYNTGPITAVSRGDAYTGGIVGESFFYSNYANCYNVGPITVSASYACTGGIAGEVCGETAHVNCYNIGQISVSANYTHTGGIVGSLWNFFHGKARITNCHFLEGTVGDTEPSLIGRIGTAPVIIDGGHPGNSYPLRETHQSSGAKGPEEMKAALEDALSGSSIYYTGTVINGYHEFAGWDFENVWTVIDGENEGYPVLRAFYPEDPEDPEGPGGSDGSDGTDGPENPDGTDGPDGPENPGGSDGSDGTDGPENPGGSDGTDKGRSGALPIFLIAAAVLFAVLVVGFLLRK